MKLLLVSLLSALVSVAATLASGPEATAAPKSEDSEARERLATLSARAERLAQRADDLERDLALAPAMAAPLEPVEIALPGEEEIGRAVRRWLELHQLGESVLIDGMKRGDASLEAVAALPLDELLAWFAERTAWGDDVNEMYELVRKAGRMDELVAAAEARAEANPNDPDAQLDLGLVYLQKLFEIGAKPEAGLLAQSADEAFGRALTLDPTNTTARFTKAVALSNWPPFMGKTAESIEHFELLVGQIEEQGTTEGFEEAYLYLGNMYDRTGDGEKALAIWERGLTWFPDDPALQEQLELVRSAETSEEE